MIGQLRGTVVERRPPELVLDVHGVGYELEASMNTFYALPEGGEVVTLYTHLVVREDAQLLYGFASERERRMFRELIRVRGVGAKLALAILSGMSVDQFIQSVREENTAALVRLPGIGKKTAERLMIEVRDRLDEWDTFTPKAEAVAITATREDPRSEAVHALIALGYKPQEASRLVQAVDDEVAGQGSEALIRLALKQSVRL